MTYQNQQPNKQKRVVVIVRPSATTELDQRCPKKMKCDKYEQSKPLGRECLDRGGCPEWKEVLMTRVALMALLV